MRAVIRGTGLYAPPDVVPNERMSRLMDTTDEWIIQRTGIRERRFARQDQATSDMAVPAARQALEEAGLRPEDLDYIVFATMTPDHYFPGAGPIFQRKLGVTHVPCLDIRQQCAGFLFGMQLVDAMVRSGQRKNVLLVGAEVHAGFMPWTRWDIAFGESDDRVSDEEFAWNTQFRDRTVLFADAGGAMVFSAEEGEGSGGLEDVMVHSDGQYAEKMWVDGAGSAYRPWIDPKMASEGRIVPIVLGREVFRMAVTVMPDAVQTILKRNGYTLDDVDLLIMHQANLRINEAVQKKLELPDEKVFNNIQRYGNTTAATLPLAFHEARAERDLSPGKLVCFVALGSGLSWGAALYRC